MSFSAAQYIYTNVEKKLSPHGRDGFQIWLRTRDVLDEADETELQNRLGDFEERKTDGEEPVTRHLYFRLPSGRMVISRSVPLAETDKFNRTGRFYAHAFILDPSDFRRLDNDPFAILDQVTFQSTLDDGLKAGDPATGTIPPATLDERPAERNGTSLSSEQLAPLLTVLLRACDGERPVILGVPGTPAQALGLVRELFAWLPPSLRLACSFDTLSTGRSLTQVPFAVVGLPPGGPPRRVLNLLQVDPARQALTQPVPGAMPGTFNSWLLKELAQSSSPPLLSRAEAVFQLGRCLDRGQVIAEELSAVDAPTFQEIACSDSGVPKLERLLRARLETDVGPALAPLLFALANNALRSEGLNELRRLGEPYPFDVLLRWLLTVYEQRSADEIERETEVPALKEVLERTKNVEGEGAVLRKKLVLILYRWGRSWSHLARRLRDSKTIPDDMYQWFVSFALQTVPIRVHMGTGYSDGGVWLGPQVECPDPAQRDESLRLVGCLFGIDPQDEGGGASLPPERWSWTLETLKSWIAPVAE